jgi:ABC-type multidrug transport system permease subunit
MSAVLGWRAQRSILAERYRACWVGDWASGLVLVGQAPLIGALCAVVWGEVATDTPSLYFVLSLTAVWLGATAACREVVKERDVIERERLFGLSMPAYVLSRAEVLGGMTLAQVVLLQVAVEWSLSLRGLFPAQTLALWGAAMAGVGLGLLVSALARTQAQAAGAVPLLIVPQLLFSEFAISKDKFGPVVAQVERLMPARHAYRAFVELAALERDWAALLTPYLAMPLMTLTLLALTTAVLAIRRDVVGGA